MEYVQTQNKIKLLFKKIVEPGYVMNNYYADELINKLNNCTDDPELAFLEYVPLVSDLIIDSLGYTENAHISVKVFLIRMLAIASFRELHFAKMFARKGENIMKGFKEINSSDMSPSLRVAYMELALALAHHDSGVSWMLETSIWKDVLDLCKTQQTVFVVRQTYKFAAKFLWRLNDMGDETNLRLVLNYVLSPVTEIDFLKIDTISIEDEEKVAKKVDPTLQILLLVMTEKNRIKQPTIIMNLLLKELPITSLLYIMFDRLRQEDTALLVTRVLFWLILAKIFLTKPITADVEHDFNDFMELGVMYFNTIQSLVKRRSARLVLDFCNNCNLIWTMVWNGKDNSDKGTPYTKLQNKLLLICLIPTLVYVKKSLKCLSEMTNNNFHQFLCKFYGETCEHTARAAYAVRDLTLELDTSTVTLQSVKRLTCIKSHLNDSQANLMFQALFYVLKQFDPTEWTCDWEFDDSEVRVNVMTYVLDIVLYLVKNHNINWHESLEIICLYNVVYCILKRTDLSCKFIVTALNVIAVTVKKFLQPNLSLLMESKPGAQSSSIDELGNLIYMKLHDRHWEIRDSALELLLVCTEISYIKFPPFQKQIIANQLVNVAATIAFNDFESYVQVSALKCIGAASKISAIWEELKKQYPDIKDRLISILRNNQEGIVRKEACNVLCDVYQNLKLTPEYKQTLYEHMVSAALTDFHWEVQISSLKFWRIVIQSLLSDQGMLDGTFPPVTFSKETRKIVTLNETEIQKRLIKILDELSSIGCLTVLVKLLHQDTEVEIMDLSLNISLEFLNILNQYKVPDLLKPVDNEIGSIEEFTSNIVEEDSGIEVISEPEKVAVSDNVIEEILNSNDTNLLANIYETHMTLHGDTPKLTSKPKVKLLQSASPYFFVNFLKGKDFKAVIEQKKSWKIGIRSLSSLLDDVLGIYDINDDVNTMDCY